MTVATQPALQRKSLVRSFELKETDEAARTFTGRSAAFSLDQGGDIILPGAFKRTLADFKRSKGKVIPLLDSHSRGSFRDVVGKMLEGAEVADGLETTFQVIDGPDGDELLRRIKGGYVDGLSIGYRVVEQRNPTQEEARTGVYRYLKELQLLEVSVVIFPMNEDARVDLSTVKSLLAKGDALTPEDRAELMDVHQQLSALLKQAAPGDAPAPPAPGLAPEDPARLKLAAKVRDLKLSGLRLGLS